MKQFRGAKGVVQLGCRCWTNQSLLTTKLNPTIAPQNEKRCNRVSGVGQLPLGKREGGREIEFMRIAMDL